MIMGVIVVYFAAKTDFRPSRKYLNLPPFGENPFQSQIETNLRYVLLVGSGHPG